MLLAHPLYYSISQLPGNELRFHTLFYHCDGKPRGLQYRRSSIGNQIKESLSELPVDAIQPVSFTDFPFLNEEKEKDLPCDQK